VVALFNWDSVYSAVRAKSLSIIHAHFHFYMIMNYDTDTGANLHQICTSDGRYSHIRYQGYGAVLPGSSTLQSSTSNSTSRINNSVHNKMTKYLSLCVRGLASSHHSRHKRRRHCINTNLTSHPADKWRHVKRHYDNSRRNVLRWTWKQKIHSKLW